MSENDKDLPEKKAKESAAPAASSGKPDSDKSEAAEPAGQKPVDDKPTTAKTESKPTKPIKPKKPRKPMNKPVLIGALLGFVLVLGLAGGGYWLWLQVEQMKVDQAAQVSALEQALSNNESRLAQLQSRAQANSNWQQAVADLEDLVTASAQRWNRQSNRTDERWPLEEALTLTRLAQQRLQLDASATIAIGLLKSADEVLASQDQAAVLPLRRQLAEDILALETTSAADVNGFFFSLDAIANQIRDLDWVPQPTLQTDIPEDVSPMLGFWHGLKQIVVIQRLDVPMEAPALQSDFEYWRQHTLLLIEQIQLALLARNQSLYEAGLEQAAAQLSVMASQFDVDVWQARLAELRAAVLNPNWPDITNSAQAIELYLSEQDDSAEPSNGEASQ